jgi:hypothetical protein
MTSFDAPHQAGQHDPDYNPMELPYRPAALTSLSDARQSTGGDMLAQDHRDLDDDLDAKTLRLRERIERRGFFRDLLRACTSDEERRAQVKRCIRQLEHTLAEDIRAAIVASLDDSLAGLHYTFKQRRDWIAARLGVSVATANARVKRGQQVLALAARMAAERPDDVADSGPVAASPKCIKPDLRKATRNTPFDSDARRAAIASLSPDEQNAFVQLLERKSVEGEIDAIDKADRASRITMLPHAFNRVLDDVGRSDDQSRRLLARMSPEDRKALVAEWVSEDIDAAIGGNADQRKAARDKYGSREYDRMVRQYVEQNKARGVAA